MLDIQLQKYAIHELTFLNAGAGRKSGAYRERLPFLRGSISGLPSGAPPLVLTADLQGRTDYGDTDETLPGCVIPETLIDIEVDNDLPPIESCLSLLAGDFYTYPNATKRGGTGPVDAVWESFEMYSLELLGVAGNHDSFRRKPQGLLDKSCIHLDGLRIGGVSGIIGSSNKVNRRSPEAFLDALTSALSEDPHILVLHSAPHVDSLNPGSEDLTAMLHDYRFEGLLVCGHLPWKERIQRVGRCVCLNVHEAVVVLETEK